jgi:hypothetical protein
MKTPADKRPRSRDFGLEIQFQHQARRLPAPSRPGLLARLRPDRTFYQLDPTTGHHHRL